MKDIEQMDAFFTKELKSFIEKSNISHLESNGEAIMVFDANLRLADISDYSELVRFAEELEKYFKQPMPYPSRTT